MTKTKMIVHTDLDPSEVEIEIPTDTSITRSEVKNLVAKKEDVDVADIWIDWEKTEVPSNVTYNLIGSITQKQIEDLESTVANNVDDGYDVVAQGMHEASAQWAEENGFDPKDVDGIVELDNFSIRNDQRQIEMYVRRIQGWKPEHREQLLALLAG